MEPDYSYIQVSLQDNMVEDVFGALMEAGQAPSDKYDLHVTMMYDEREHKEPLVELDKTKTFAAKIISMGKLGDAYVFHLTSPQMLEEFRSLKEAGYEHSYGTPLFHMSLGYKLDAYNHLELEQVFAEWMGRELIFTNMSFGFIKDK
jgi:hypothetical protein